jgi:hypothetical protein
MWMPSRLERLAPNDDGAMMTAEMHDPNNAKAHKLQRNGLRRLARGRGLDLRESSYGFSLVDGDKNRVDGRNDLTLDEIKAYLTHQP